MSASIQFLRVTVVPNLFAFSQTETIDVHVSGSGGVNQGMVAFTVDGQTVSASVDGSGDATVSLTLPLLTSASPQSISAVFSEANHSPTSATQTVMWTPWNVLLPSIDTFAADGSQSVQSFLAGLPLLDFVYTAQGRLEKLIFGPGLLSWDLSSISGPTVGTSDGALPAGG